MDLKDKPVRVLLVEDDEEDYLIVKRLFRYMSNAQFTLDWTATYDEAADLIDAAQHDVYLIDYRLGAQTGLELLQRFTLAQRPEPFIILTGASDEQVERSAMEQGVADYLVKGRFDAELLSRVILYSLQRKQSEMQRVDHLMELNKSKDEFIALASHQLRTPATAVKQYLGMMLQGYAGEVSDDHKTLLTHAYNSNERQIQIVEDLLRTARLDMQKVALRKSVVDISSLIEKAIRDVSTFLNERQQELSYKKPARPIYCEVDGNYLSMALTNILDNASKYTAQDKKIFVSVRQTSTTPKQVVIRVRDQGVGIAKQDMSKLFKKFSRVFNPLSIEVGGSGLGLYWAEKVVELHGGNITVDSKVGTGTTFTISVPVTAGEPKVATAAA